MLVKKMRYNSDWKESTSEFMHRNKNDNNQIYMIDKCLEYFRFS